MGKIIAIIALFILILGGLVIWNKNQLKNVSRKVRFVEVSNINSSNTYTNKEVGYSLKLPSGWQTWKRQTPSIENELTKVLRAAPTQEELYGGETIAIYAPIDVRKEYKYFDFSKGLEGEEIDFSKLPTIYAVATSEYVEIDGHRALVNTLTDDLRESDDFVSRCDCTSKMIYIEIDKNHMLPIFGGWDNSENDKESAFDKALSTFKFL